MCIYIYSLYSFIISHHVQKPNVGVRFRMKNMSLKTSVGDKGNWKQSGQTLSNSPLSGWCSLKEPFPHCLCNAIFVKCGMSTKLLMNYSLCSDFVYAFLFIAPFL